MKRRNFIVGSMITFGTIKTIASKAKGHLDQYMKNDIFQITDDHSGVIYLTRGSIVKLPENPTPVQSILHFDLIHYRIGKAPVILPNGHKVDAHLKEKINVTKELLVQKGKKFYLQYTGPDVGWIILS